MRTFTTISLAGALAAGLIATPAAAASDFELLGGWSTQPAPTSHDQGAVIAPYATCAYNQYDDPDSYTVAVTQDGHWVRGSSDGYALVRPGTYTVTVTATCWGEAKTARRTLRVSAYRDSQTVSRAEYRRIHKGQSIRKVRKIIGGKLDYLYAWKGKKVYRKPNTVIWGDAQFTFRKGKLVSKDWFSGGHD